MKTVKQLLCGVAVLLAASCAKEKVTAPACGEGITQITASWGDENSKTVLGEDGVSVLWSPNDEISVFYNTAGVKFTALNTQPVDQTMFVSSQAIIFGGTEGYIKNYLYGVYPYSSANAQDGDIITLTVPASQTAVEGSFGRGAFPSVGRSKDTNIAFYNVCGGLCFTLSQYGIVRIEFSGNNDEILAGQVGVVFDEDGRPVVSDVIEGASTVTLTIPDEGIFKVGKKYYISMLPILLEKGFTIVFYKHNDLREKGCLTVNEAREIKRSFFGMLNEADKNIDFIRWDLPSGAVDLGLSVLWHQCNLGASSPEEYGHYFARGDVKGQTWNGSSWSNGGFSSYPDYEVDDNDNLKPAYDAAHVLLGGSWRMPTAAEQWELINNCTCEWTTYNGVYGRLFTSKNLDYYGKSISIFLPAAGYGGNSSLLNASSYGYYWSSTFDGGNYARYLYFHSDDVYVDCLYRYYGFSVRPVSDR